MNAPASASDPAQRNLAGRRLGRYEVLTQLASGGMAAVYVARAQGVAGFERLVAVKVLHPHLAHEDEFISMFLDEARLAARIRHPNVVATLDISDTHGDGFFIVMDYIEGDHLGALLQRAARQGKRLPPGVVSRICIDALSGLAAAHNLTDEHGVPLNLVHRDVSPHNVMVGVDGISRLTDFGVAKAEVRLTSTREGQFKGKLAYMAPEQASTGNADQRSDLFSMGIILWESLTGRRLFRGENNAETLHKVLQSEIPPPSSLWPELEPFDEVVLKALQREPDERFQTAEDFAEALEEAARAHNGLSTNRAVGDVVRTYTGEKLQQERDRIKGAIEFLGRTDMSEAAMPIPRDGSASLSSASSLGSLSSISASGRRPLEGEHNTLAARPGTISQQMPMEHGRSNRLVIVLGAVVLLLLGAVGAFALVVLRGGDQDGEEAAEPATVEPTGAAGDPGAHEPGVGGEENPLAVDPEDAEEPSDEEAADDEEKAAAKDEEEKTADEDQVRDEDDEAEKPGATRWQRRQRAAQRRQRQQEQQEQEDKKAEAETEETESKEEPKAEPKPRPKPKPKPKQRQESDDDPIFNPYR
ncbi:MAG: serine/threonine-protein kinase [Myxococcota bacterium]